MTNLKTTYLGLKLRNPIVASSSPQTRTLETIRQLIDAGIGALILPSLFEEQIELQGLGYNQFPEYNQMLPEALRHIPKMGEYNQGVNGYLAHIYAVRKLIKETVGANEVPIIASLNGYYSGGWVDYARVIEAAGADAIELNIYYLETKPHIKGSEIEEMYIDLIKRVKRAVSIPVSVKIGPYFTALSNIAHRLAEAGADGIVFFNRFYQPDIDLEAETAVSTLDLSHPAELRLRLRWTSLLYGKIPSDIALTGGIYTGDDVAKALLAGGQVAMMASALLRHGPDHVRDVRQGLINWLESQNHDSIDEIRGKLSYQNSKNISAIERANYMTILREADIRN